MHLFLAVTECSKLSRSSHYQVEIGGGRRNENDEKVSNSCWAAAVRAAGYGFGEIGFVHIIRCDAGPGRHAQFERWRELDSVECRTAARDRFHGGDTRDRHR